MGDIAFLAALESQDSQAKLQQQGTINIVSWRDPPSKWRASRTVSWLLATGALFLRKLEHSIPPEVWRSSGCHRGRKIHLWPPHPHVSGSVPETGQEEGVRRKIDYPVVKKPKIYPS